MSIGMPTAEACVEHALEESIDGDDGWLKIVHATKRRMREGFYPQWAVDFLVQKQNLSDKYTDNDAFAFAKFWADIMTGEVLIKCVDICDEPGSDCDAERMNESLALLPAPFSAEFRGGSIDHDGVIEWSEDVLFDEWSLSADGTENVREIPIDASSAILEVGTTSGAKSLIQLRQYCALARWPYGYKQVFIARRKKPVDLSEIFNVQSLS